MSFTSTYIKTIPLGPDTVMVLYSWSGASVTTGTIVSSAYLSLIDTASCSDNVGANAVQLQENYNGGTSNGDITLTFTSSDAGTLTLIGRPRRS